METGTWVGSVAAVLAVGGVTAVLFAALLPETRPATVVGGFGLLLTALLVDGVARLRRRRTSPGDAPRRSDRTRRPAPASPTGWPR